jgi:hypothetical protein
VISGFNREAGDSPIADPLVMSRHSSVSLNWAGSNTYLSRSLDDHSQDCVSLFR